MRLVSLLCVAWLSVLTISCGPGPGTLATSSAPPEAAAKAQSPTTVLVLVDSSVYPQVKDGLETYFKDVQREHTVHFKVLSQPFYTMKPPAIREILKKEYAAAKPSALSRSAAPVVGAIMVGPIPVALRGQVGMELIPAPLYYEDFDAKWTGPQAADGIFADIQTDRMTNATEIWTTWWVPPTLNGDEQVKMLQGYLAKLHEYHQGEIDGTDSMIFLSDARWNQVELGEAWTVLMKGVIEPTGQKFAMYSTNPEAEEHIKPADGKAFKVEEFRGAWTSKRWQHSHSIHHGSPNGFYWVGGALVVGNLDLPSFDRAGANIVTASGCSNGNFRASVGPKPNYAQSIGNVLIFSPRTITVTYFGAAASQSVGTFASYHTQLFESLDPARNSYIAEGYYKMRNTDHVWGVSHYIFRGMDDKVLLGDPFARYHVKKS